MATDGFWLSLGVFAPSCAGHGPALFAQSALSVGDLLTAGAAVLRRGAEDSRAVALLTCRSPQRGWVAHAWLQERQLLGSRARTWGASAGPYPGGRQLAWAVAASGEAEGAWAPQTLEASCQLSLGDGLILSPGLLARASPASTTVTALIKSSWSF